MVVALLSLRGSLNGRDGAYVGGLRPRGSGELLSRQRDYHALLRGKVLWPLQRTATYGDRAWRACSGTPTCLGMGARSRSTLVTPVRGAAGGETYRLLLKLLPRPLGKGGIQSGQGERWLAA